MGQHHARVLSALDGVDFVGIADPACESPPLLSSADLFSDIDALLDQGIDMCVVAAPTNMHEPLGLRLADAGVHTLIEKPLAVDEVGAHRLAAAFQEAGLVGAVGHIERYNPALQNMRARLEQEELGAVYQVSTRRQGPFPSRIADVGVVKDLGSHDIDLTMWVTGSDYHLVSAHTAFRSGRSHEDLVVVAGRLLDGTVTSHLVNWLSPNKDRVTIVTGANGSFVADTLTADLTFFENGSVATTWDSVAKFRGVSEGNMIRYAFPKHEPLRTELEAFRDAVLGKDSRVVTMPEGAAAVVVADSVLLSARTNQVVDVSTSRRAVLAG
jgi:UDP-N-acetylglucosamine 3-dehydrogenase